MNYQPDEETDAAAWNAATDEERVEACGRAHQLLPTWHPPVLNVRLHASMHAVVETQLANELPEVRETLTRLRGEGVSRHQAIHAIAGVVADELQRVLRDKKPFDRQGYAQRLRALTKESVAEAGSTPKD
jgi:hypothetical protein